MVSPFSKIVVDKQEEAKFRRRALRVYPNEHIEALWGFVRGDVLYVCAFMDMEYNVDDNGKPLKAKPDSLTYLDEELDNHEEEAKEHRLEFLGTIHTHPDCQLTHFSEGDLLDSQDTQEAVIGICAIEIKGEGKKQRRKCQIAYWPTVRPLQVEHRTWDATTSKSRRKARSRRR